jgi:hypothetical protein
MTIATPISAGRCFSNLVYASRPPAEPPTQTIGKFFATFLAFIDIYSFSIYKFYNKVSSELE